MTDLWMVRLDRPMRQKESEALLALLPQERRNRLHGHAPEKQPEVLCAYGLLLALLRPVLGADLEHLELDFDHYQAAVEERQEELADTQTEAMASIIAEQTEAYILDKAGELGLEVTVRVETRTEGNGIPVPWSAELTGSWSQALASALETELGIPAERQVWHEREAEN